MPDINEHKPVSLEKKIEFKKEYDLPVYYQPGGIPVMMLVQPKHVKKKENISKFNNQKKISTRLRSSKEVIGYFIDVKDGSIGHIDDLIFEEKSTWKIHYFVVNFRDWLRKKKVLVSPKFINEFKWETESVKINLTKKKIMNCQEYCQS
jgi:hypothetical protein